MRTRTLLADIIVAASIALCIFGKKSRRSQLALVGRQDAVFDGCSVPAGAFLFARDARAVS